MSSLNGNALNMLEWTGVACSLAGSVLNARGRRCSFLLWTVSAVLLGFVAAEVHRTGWLALQIFGVAINCYGVYCWRGNAPVRGRTEEKLTEEVCHATQ